VKTKYLTMLVEHKATGEWEEEAVDVPIRYASDSEFWSRLGERVGKRVQAYPPEDWNCKAIVSDAPGTWRTSSSHAA
jgi:hypothetical protein